MASNWSPSAELWSSDGLSLVYTFPIVQDHNLPRQEKKSIKQSNFRSQGGIIIPGGDNMWELFFKFVVVGEDYSAIATALEALESTVAYNTAYLIRIDINQTTYFNQSSGGYKVKRTKPFQYLDREQDRMITVQKTQVFFDVNSW